MGHIKIATFALPHVRLPTIALPHLVYKSNEHHKEEYRERDKLHAGDHESMAVMADVHQRMEQPPSTWAAYSSKSGGMMSIVEMEYRELMEKKAEGSHTGVEKELTDLAAACICALKKMKAM